MTAEEYRIEVLKAGNQKPWEMWPRLSHADVIHPADVELDSAGNITAMPLLRRKPCFGRPEVFFRQGGRVRMATNRWGKRIESRSHQCGKCPLETWQSCAKVATHRVKANPDILTAFLAWKSSWNTHPGATAVYTGEGSGQLWGAFKEAIGARGPFSNVNDQALAIEAAHKREAQTETWRQSKATYRDRVRAKRRADQQPPTLQYAQNAWDECERRRDAIEAVLGDPTMPKCLSKVAMKDRRRTAALTAHAWFVRELLIESGREPGPSRIAAKMVVMGLNEGVSLATLKNRVPADIARGYQSECLGIWEPFNPNADLDAFTETDDDCADQLQGGANSIETILKELSSLHPRP